nr:CRISPR-associated RAMP protein [Anaerolineae bacterium]
MFEHFDNRTIIEGAVTVTGGLHIGAGGQIQPGGTDNPVIRDALGRPFIPGSSLKGALRSFCERTLYTLNHPRMPACLITSGMGNCLSVGSYKEEFERIKEEFEAHRITEREYADFIQTHLCAVCRLFGSPYQAAKVYVQDLHLAEPLPAPVQLRDGVAIDRDLLTAVPRRKFDYEVVPAATSFRLRILVENAWDEELGLLFLALRQLRAGDIPLGGKSSRGLGTVTCEIHRIQHIQGRVRQSLLDYLTWQPTAEGSSERPGEVPNPELFMQRKIDALLEILRRPSDAQGTTEPA